MVRSTLFPTEIKMITTTMINTMRTTTTMTMTMPMEIIRKIQEDAAFPYATLNKTYLQRQHE